MKFFLGTTNKDKVREIASILSATGCTYELTEPVDPDETEPDFEGNAILKARAYAAHASGITISEDSGILIASLGNLPGPWSARFADCDLDVSIGSVLAYHASNRLRKEIDQLNNARVLELMEGIEQPRRAAMFVVVLAVATPGGEILFKARGESHGWIATEARGKNGFGYDPIFVGQDTGGRTYAELDSNRKNLRSHRKWVLNEFQAWLGKFLKAQEERGQLQ